MKQKDFIGRAISIHGTKYNYSLVDYKTSKIKVTIICDIHGEFNQTPHDHLMGCNCPACSIIIRGNKRSSSIDSFITKANQVHLNQYDYSQVQYKNAHTKINIICPIHGMFEQVAYAHSNGQGCPNCYDTIRKTNAPSWRLTNWINASKRSKTFDSYKVYVIHCFNDTESFIKIGRTFNTIGRRFYSQIPYQFKVLKIITNQDAEYIYNLETRVKRRFKDLKYLPAIKFGGMHECFKIT